MTDFSGVAPAYAVPELLEKVGLNVDDIDVYELNEGTIPNCSEISDSSVRISVRLLYSENRNRSQESQPQRWCNRNWTSPWRNRWTSYRHSGRSIGRKWREIRCDKYVRKYRTRNGNVDRARIDSPHTQRDRTFQNITNGHMHSIYGLD